MESVPVDSAGSVGVSEAFVEVVRDALLHLYDLTYLQTHPLVGFRGISARERVDGKVLRQALLDAIGAVHPGPGVPTNSRAWRSYRILELRYVVGNEVDDIVGEIALSKRQYHREHHRALEAVASILWRDWRPADGQEIPAAPTAEANVTDLTRQEAEHLSPESGSGQPIDPIEVLHGVRDLLQPLCAQRSVTLELRLPDRLPPIRGDRVALRQGLLSILTPLLVTSGPATVRIDVAAGPGRIEARIASADAPRESHERSVEQGRPFVETLGGTVECAPPDERFSSSTIRISLPASDRPTLLVVDNNADFIQLIERYLAADDWRVVGASDVEQAFTAVQQRRPAAILLDVVLPGRDGWDLLLRLKETPEVRDTPVIICSVLREAEMATSLGAAAYICKPVDRRLLLQTLERVTA